MKARAGWSRVVATLVLGVGLGAGACSDAGPSGPGSWNGMVRSSTAPAGAVILELQGTGIRSIEGRGPTEGFARRIASSASGSETWRVVLVTSTPGPMGFEVVVEDIGGDAPRAVVLSAVDGGDEPLTGLSSFSVEMTR